MLALYRRALRFPQLWLIGGSALLAAGLIALAAAAPAQWIPAALWGALGWGVSEYAFHRFVLHLPRPRARWLQPVHAMLHWQHHQQPDDPRRLFIPLPGVLSLFALWSGIGHALGGLASGAGAAFGLGAMLLWYETTHLAAHVNYRPRTRWGQLMKRLHRLHHYKNERYWFGVTHPLIDWLAGTWPAHAEVEKSATARNLGIEIER